MAIPRVRMFAGPNGSGKSDLIQRLKNSDLPLGPIVNADIILFSLEKAGFIDLHQFQLTGLIQSEWDLAINRIGELTSRVEKAGSLSTVEIKEGVLVCEGDNLNAYSAALIADFLRYMMIGQLISFSFETVMSHPGKINFLQVAKQKGFKAYLYFVATDDPAINISRVQNRVQKGGHSVPKHKIVK